MSYPWVLSPDPEIWALTTSWFRLSVFTFNSLEQIFLPPTCLISLWTLVNFKHHPVVRSPIISVHIVWNSSLVLTVHPCCGALHGWPCDLQLIFKSLAPAGSILDTERGISWASGPFCLPPRCYSFTTRSRPPHLSPAPRPLHTHTPPPPRHLFCS